ncbi:MAG: MarR family winged helix-turn-helix transcriptional regulator [Ekhidna sp.]
MGIAEEIKQQKFKSEYSKSIVNIIFTNSWLQQKHLSIFKSFGLTTPQFNILRILRGQHPNPATVNLLIDRMLDKSSNASRIVDKLEGKELVKRVQCKNDRRAVDVYITDLGLELLSKLDLVIDETQSTNTNLTEEESMELNKLLDKMRS